MNTKYNLISLLQFYQQDVIGYILHIRGNTFLHHIIRKHGSVGGGGGGGLYQIWFLILFCCYSLSVHLIVDIVTLSHCVQYRVTNTEPHCCYNSALLLSCQDSHVPKTIANSINRMALWTKTVIKNRF